MDARTKIFGAVALLFVGALISEGVRRTWDAWNWTGPDLAAQLAAVPFAPVSPMPGPDASYAELSQWTDMRGLIIGTVRNTGTQPAKGVYLTIPGAFLLKRGSRDEAAVPTEQRIELGTFPQGHVEEIWVWTTNRYTSIRWIEVAEFALSYDEGVGEIDAIVLPGAFAATIDWLIGPWFFLFVGATAGALYLASDLLTFRAKNKLAAANVSTEKKDDAMARE